MMTVKFANSKNLKNLGNIEKIEKIRVFIYSYHDSVHSF